MTDARDRTAGAEKLAVEHADGIAMPVLQSMFHCSRGALADLLVSAWFKGWDARDEELAHYRRVAEASGAFFSQMVEMYGAGMGTSALQVDYAFTDLEAFLAKREKGGES